MTTTKPSRLRRASVAAIATVTAAFVTGCTPAEVQFWKRWHAATATCHGAVDWLWPAESRAWAHAIVDRESRGIATAQNPTSSAAGCFQLLRMHSWRFNATGSSWADRYDARANTAAALHLYREAGTRPWT